MSNDTPRDWEELKKLAEAATPGPWDHETKKYSEAIYTPHRSGPSISISWGAGSRNSPIWGTPERAKADAAFIAAANPATVLDLIAEVERLRDAYTGAMEDKRMWKNRFLHGEKELSQLKAERDAEKRDSFAHGYLIAVANLMNLHGSEVEAEDVLGELGETEGVIKRLDLTDYDAQPLRKLFREISRKRRSALNTGEKDG